MLAESSSFHMASVASGDLGPGIPAGPHLCSSTDGVPVSPGQWIGDTW